MKIRLVAVSGLVALAYALSAHAEQAEAPSITPTELAERRASSSAPAVVDVRTAAEYATGHVPGAVNIPYDEVADRISEIDAGNGVALYCMVGPRARKGEAALMAAGHTSILHLEGGMVAWKEAGLPVEGAP